MSYASDYDDFEQSSQGETDGIGETLEDFCYKMFGRPMWELSGREIADLNWQYKQERKTK